MYKNVCRHCHAEIECENVKVFANHVRWCKPQNNDIEKYFLKCCCLECRVEINVQSLKLHLEKHDKEHRPKEVTGNCLQCEAPLHNKNSKFCSRSCSAKYNNHIRFPKKPEKPKREQITASWIGFCKCCGSLFSRQYRTTTKDYCSKDCRMTVVALNRGRHKKSWLEQSFSDWLDSKFIIYETEVTVKNNDSGKWYFLDFLFKDLNLVIELDGSQHKDTVESDAMRDNYLRTLGYTVLRITHKEYQSKSRLEEIELLLGLQQ